MATKRRKLKPSCERPDDEEAARVRKRKKVSFTFEDCSSNDNEEGGKEITRETSNLKEDMFSSEATGETSKEDCLGSENRTRVLRNISEPQEEIVNKSEITRTRQKCDTDDTSKLVRNTATHNKSEEANSNEYITITPCSISDKHVSSEIEQCLTSENKNSETRYDDDDKSNKDNEKKFVRRRLRYCEFNDSSRLSKGRGKRNEFARNSHECKSKSRIRRIRFQNSDGTSKLTKSEEISDETEVSDDKSTEQTVKRRCKLYSTINKPSMPKTLVTGSTSDVDIARREAPCVDDDKSVKTAKNIIKLNQDNYKIKTNDEKLAKSRRKRCPSCKESNTDVSVKIVRSRQKSKKNDSDECDAKTIRRLVLMEGDENRHQIERKSKSNKKSVVKDECNIPRKCGPYTILDEIDEIIEKGTKPKRIMRCNRIKCPSCDDNDGKIYTTKYSRNRHSPHQVYDGKKKSIRRTRSRSTTQCGTGRRTSSTRSKRSNDGESYDGCQLERTKKKCPESKTSYTSTINPKDKCSNKRTKKESPKRPDSDDSEDSEDCDDTDDSDDDYSDESDDSDDSDSNSEDCEDSDDDDSGDSDDSCVEEICEPKPHYSRRTKCYGQETKAQRGNEKCPTCDTTTKRQRSVRRRSYCDTKRGVLSAPVNMAQKRNKRPRSRQSTHISRKSCYMSNSNRANKKKNEFTKNGYCDGDKDCCVDNYDVDCDDDLDYDDKMNNKINLADWLDESLAATTRWWLRRRCGGCEDEWDPKSSGAKDRCKQCLDEENDEVKEAEKRRKRRQKECGECDCGPASRKRRRQREDDDCCTPVVLILNKYNNDDYDDEIHTTRKCSPKRRSQHKSCDGGKRKITRTRSQYCGVNVGENRSCRRKRNL